MALLEYILILLAINGVVCAVVTALVRTKALAIAASTIITEMVLAIVFLVQASQSSYAADIILGANLTAIFSTPVMLVSSFIFESLLRSWWRRHSSKSEATKTEDAVERNLDQR